MLEGTHRGHLNLAHVERFVLLSARRLDLNMIPRPAAMPHIGFLWAKPLARQLSARILVRKGGFCRRGKGRKAGGTVPYLTCPIVWPKVVQQPAENFVRLSFTRNYVSVLVYGRNETHIILAHNPHQISIVCRRRWEIYKQRQERREVSRLAGHRLIPVIRGRCRSPLRGAG